MNGRDTASTQESDRPDGKDSRIPIGLIASPGAREPQVSLESFPDKLVFDRVPTRVGSTTDLKKFPASRTLLRELLDELAPCFQNLRFHTTRGTARGVARLRSSETTSSLDLRAYLPGDYGGLVQLAAKCVRRELAAMIILSDSQHFGSDGPENRAIYRICIRMQIPILNSVRSAAEWVREQLPVLVDRGWSIVMAPGEAPEGIRHNPGLLVDRRSQTIALIAHDKKKEELISFVEEFGGLIASYHRILATGTTGWLIKLLFAPENRRTEFLSIAKGTLEPDRVKTLTRTAAKVKHKLWMGGFPLAQPSLVEKVYPQPSGPDGGDILVAEEVLRGTCDYVVFFQDPMQAHPHEADIRLLRRTSHLPGTDAVCISDSDSAKVWAKRKTELGS